MAIPKPAVATNRPARPLNIVPRIAAIAKPVATRNPKTAAAIGFDLATIGTADLDDIGELLEAGKQLALGLIPTAAPATPPTWREIVEPAVRLVDRLGFPRRALAERIVVTPACGLGGTPLSWARRVLTLATEAAHALADEPEALTFA